MFERQLSLNIDRVTVPTICPRGCQRRLIMDWAKVLTCPACGYEHYAGMSSGSKATAYSHGSTLHPRMLTG